MLKKLILIFSIVLILTSCFGDFELVEEKEYSKSEIDSIQRNFVRNLKIDSTISLNEFKSIYGDNFERYKFDIILDDKLKINKDSIFFPIYIHNNNKDDSYYGLWLLNLNKNEIETKFHLSKETGAYFNDIISIKKYDTNWQLILPDTFLHTNSGKLKIINFRKNKLLYEDTLKQDPNIPFLDEEFIYFKHPNIFTLINDTLFINNIELKTKSKFINEKNIKIKYCKFLKDSILFYCTFYDGITKKGMLASTDYYKLNFKKLFSFEVQNKDYIKNFEYLTDEIIIVRSYEKLFLLNINELKETRIPIEEINGYKYINNNLFVMSKKGLYIFNIQNQKSKLLKEIDNRDSYLRFIYPNFYFIDNSLENPIQFIYNTIQNSFIKETNDLNYSKRLSDKIFVSESGTAIYILK